MEAATNAINISTATINDVPVKFLSQMKGKFSLSKAFLDQRNIEINKVPIEIYLNPDKGHFEIGRKTEPDIMNVKGIVRNNPKQYQAIQKALESSFSLIQGPPGTGKTYTGIKLVYLFNQINLKWQERGNDKKQIMFCGPSNESLDLVAKRMTKKLGEHCPKMVRWYGSSIESQEFPIPGKTSTLGGGKGTKADEQLRSIPCIY
ncbi:unnamed protein product [Mytilus edulis]|uniref:DNA2/NAM7 helicase helicase domain-containing protein n=1 Tax=Mytilus edulis TaxID=6550 RepID=A0A8S3TQ93_MYTED|nr:unnamed protein product [Mytilus edulis]